MAPVEAAFRRPPPVFEVFVARVFVFAPAGLRAGRSAAAVAATGLADFGGMLV